MTLDHRNLMHTLSVEKTFLSHTKKSLQDEPHPLRHGRALLLDDVSRFEKPERESARERERGAMLHFFFFVSLNLYLFFDLDLDPPKKTRWKTGGQSSLSRSRTRWSGPCFKHSMLFFLFLFRENFRERDPVA